MGRWKGNLCVTSSLPGLESLKDPFFLGCDRGGGGRDIRGGSSLGGKGGDKGRGGVRGVSA